MIDLREIQSFQILSRRARKVDLHSINMEIASLYSMESIVAVDSFLVHTCKYSTPMRRKVWSCGRKYHMTIDIDSILIMEWICS